MSPRGRNDGGFVLLDALIALLLVSLLAAGPARLLRTVRARGEALSAALTRDAAESVEAAEEEMRLFRRR